MSKKKKYTECSKAKLYEPRCNHKECWHLYFQKNPGKFLAYRMALAKFGPEVFDRIAGVKHRKHVEFYIKEVYGKQITK